MAHASDDDGFVVLQAAAPASALAAYADQLRAARDRLLVRSPGDEHPSLALRHHAEPAGAVDPYVLAPAARDALLSPAVVAELTAAYDAAPMLIDAVEATAGAPDDGPYRDTTYVAASAPEALTGLVVALADDVTVAVWPGSHQLPVERFSETYHHHNVERDGADALPAHRARLATVLDDAQLAPAQLVLAAGDAVLWTGTLVHGPVRGAALVAHLLPAGAEPGWFAYRPRRASRAPVGAAWMTSQHYDLVAAPLPEPEAPTAAGPGVERVEEAFVRHDVSADAATAAARRGGLVGTVRGLMGRRNQSPR